MFIFMGFYFSFSENISEFFLKIFSAFFTRLFSLLRLVNFVSTQVDDVSFSDNSIFDLIVFNIYLSFISLIFGWLDFKCIT